MWEGRSLESVRVRGAQPQPCYPLTAILGKFLALSGPLSPHPENNGGLLGDSDA